MLSSVGAHFAQSIYSFACSVVVCLFCFVNVCFSRLFIITSIPTYTNMFSYFFILNYQIVTGILFVWIIVDLIASENCTAANNRIEL